MILDSEQIADGFFKRWLYGDVNVANGDWEKCSPDWVANSSIGSTEMMTEDSGRIVKAKIGDVSFRHIERVAS